MHKSYDPEYVNRFFRVLLSTSEVLKHFRTAFLGKASPVHFFWGSFDLAVTRFSGRTAPKHPGGVPNLPNAVAQEAYSHEVSSAGFWPGGGGPIDYAAFYSTPIPRRKVLLRLWFARARRFSARTSGEFILPYEAMRTVADPRRGADGIPAKAPMTRRRTSANGIARRLECKLGEPGKVRAV